MRIANNIIIIAVVSLAANAVGWQRGTRSTNSSEFSEWSSEGEEMSTDVGSRWLSHRESQMLLRKEGGEKALPVDCCPSTSDMVEPKGGINRDGMYVELFSEGENKQRFFEVSCREGVEGKPCRFMDRKLHNQSQCMQTYSYSYAIVKEVMVEARHHHRQNQSPSFPASGTNWVLDYIRVRSGCNCVVIPRTKRKRTPNKSRRGKSKRDSEEEPQ